MDIIIPFFLGDSLGSLLFIFFISDVFGVFGIHDDGIKLGALDQTMQFLIYTDVNLTMQNQRP